MGEDSDLHMDSVKAMQQRMKKHAKKMEEKRVKKEKKNSKKDFNKKNEKKRQSASFDDDDDDLPIVPAKSAKQEAQAESVAPTAKDEAQLAKQRKRSMMQLFKATQESHQKDKEE